MKAWLLDKIGGGVESLRIGEIDDPKPAAGEVVLDVSLAALNPADRYLTEGQYPAKPTFPHILGRDGVGIVSAIGDNVSGISKGDKRIIVRSEIGVNRRGTLAERVAVPVESLVPVPAGWDDGAAAGATLVYLTAWQSMRQWSDLPETGGVVLVSGASGGVGVAVTHLASAAGHTVIGLSRSAEKSSEIRKQGAQLVLNPRNTWVKEAKEFLGKRRVDLAIDNIGGELFPQMIETLAENGRVSCVGRLAGPVPQFNTATLFFRRIQIRGVGVYSYKPAESAAIWPRIVELMGRKGYKPLVDSTFDFEQLAAAFARLHEGPMGKVLVRTK